MSKTAQAFRTISEVSEELDVPKHVLRFWELKFPQIKPMKRGGGRRYYRPEDVDLLNGIRHLLHAEAYTIKGVQKILRERGVDAVKAAGARGTSVEGVAAKAAKGRARRGVPGAARAAAASVTQARDDIPALPPGAANVVEQAIAELRAAREMLRGTAGAGNTAARVPASRNARRQA